MRDVVVIGAGLAGLTAATRLAEAGKTVTVVTKGLGGLQLGQGTIDVWGYNPDLVSTPLQAVEDASGNHPYAQFSGAEMSDALTWIKEHTGGLLVGDGQENYRLPTAVGALRPTALAQPSMLAASDIDGPVVLVGLDRFKDFYPEMAAGNLAKAGIDARVIHVDVEVREGEVDTSGTVWARSLDRPEIRERLVAAVKPQLKEGEKVGFPALLGLNPHTWEEIATALGHDVFEIPVPPPSIPGMRLNEHLTHLVKSQARLILGAAVIGFEASDGAIKSITIASAGKPKTIEARSFVLATGGFESGAITMDSYGNVHETIFDLPLAGVEDELIHDTYWGKDQPLFKVGLELDAQMQPVGADGKPVYSNLYAAGGLMAGSTRWREKSGDGVALVSALRAADAIAKLDDASGKTSAGTTGPNKSGLNNGSEA